MSNNVSSDKHDDVLLDILVKEESILGFLSSIFGFLARRTDFYYVPQDPSEDMGFPEGVAEEIVVKVLQKCDPKNWDENSESLISNNDIMCSTVAQEVEVVAENDEDELEQLADEVKSLEVIDDNITAQAKELFPEDYEPPPIRIQKNSEAYNGAVCEKYTWAQTIMELDIIIKLPAEIKGAKDLKVLINPGDLLVQSQFGEVILHDAFPFKIKSSESFWSVSEGKLLIHLEKAQERWWKKLLNEENEIDLDKIDCSRPLHELPDDHVDKVRELQWNQQRKVQGLPTSDEMRNMNILKKAWNADGSPFRGQEFDPNAVTISK